MSTRRRFEQGQPCSFCRASVGSRPGRRSLFSFLPLAAPSLFRRRQRFWQDKMAIRSVIRGSLHACIVALRHRGGSCPSPVFFFARARWGQLRSQLRLARLCLHSVVTLRTQPCLAPHRSARARALTLPWGQPSTVANHSHLSRDSLSSVVRSFMNSSSVVLFFF